MSEIAITLGELVNAEPVLKRLSEVRRPAAQAYALAKLARLVSVELRHFNAEREKLIMDMGIQTMDAESRPVTTVPQHRIPEFMERLNEVAAVIVTLSTSPLSFDLLGDVSADEVMALGSLVQFSEVV